MINQVDKISQKKGLPPGSLIHVGKVKTKSCIITSISYNADFYEQKLPSDIEECLNFDDLKLFHWINIDGLHIETIKKIGQKLDLHPLLLEDILNTKHRPQVEDYGEYIFFTLKMVQVLPKKNIIDLEQVSFVLGKNWLLSFQEQPGDVFNDIRTRLKENKGLIRKSGTDYLLYSLTDIIVDNYFLVTEFINDKIIDVEENVLHNPTEEVSFDIQKLKRVLLQFRKSIVPLREAISSLQKNELPHIKKHTLRYWRDVYEHLIHLTENIESQRDLLSSILDLYLSGVSNKMNQVMKVLTIIATIFIPLTFIAGVYGMNFENMPELKWKYGYFAVWIIMIIVAIIMILYFKRKKWL